MKKSCLSSVLLSGLLVTFLAGPAWPVQRTVVSEGFRATT
jgi:hypothetical protein